MNLLTALTALASLMLVSGCGGGSGGSPSVQTMSSNTASYSRSLVISVIGNDLTTADIGLTVEGPCGAVIKLVGATDQLVQFSCPVTGLDHFVARVRHPEGQELASLKIKAALTPQVSMTVAQGARSGFYVVELDPTLAPKTVDNFLAYVNAGFYRNTLFHRVIPGFVAQGGGYIAGPTPKAPTLPAIQLESNNGLKNLRGSIAMARTAEFNSATSQFYFNLVDNADLDFKNADNPGYAVFGKVVTGQDIVDEIGIVPTFPFSAALPNLPSANVLIISATQTR